MKKQGWNSVLFKIALTAAVGASVGMAGKASAASSCQGAGYLCFFDYSSSQYGNLFGNNPDWRQFGWNDRADIFKNDGRTSNACVYADINYAGTVWFIPRNGVWYDVPDNVISSNWWTTGDISSC